MKLGYKLLAEALSPAELVSAAVRAESAGFDFVEISDHYHPWLHSHGHSPFAWSVLGAIAARTDTLELATGVTCPFLRYHPAIVAQAAATVALLSEGRFTLGLGAGERLNEHVVGEGWPSAAVRHRMLEESIEIIRLLWEPGFHSYRGDHLTLDHARVFDLPPTPPPIVVAAGGPGSAGLAARCGDGLFCTEASEELVGSYRTDGGEGPRYAEVPLAWAESDEAALASAHRLMRFGALGWKVQAELPDEDGFEAASRYVRPEDMAPTTGYGPDPQAHLAALQQFAAAGFDHLVLLDSGPDPEGFFSFFERELAPAARELGRAPSGSAR
ncbi:TIGR03557 family F420-dependent LLM class oxidoreductase [Rhodococcus sp. D2-41]|uniref:TIGR03557 family F420-dependent LLM class oxidoreductase n=1 Tax=Speluncibacter jeojiensis TaxID=2710754 RepID=UPI00240E9F7D|nr:TIGR03557 family F420-dependent LLM class oxidoreductase [Rhodococcus sp. D2-41]MDG3010802.1 TIGR03557 family F420-dependent LLM class oxidoreductase [Rhodococcus sp. D2-41]